MSLERYLLELLDFTGRSIQSGKTGAIPAHLAPILECLGGALARVGRELPRLVWGFRGSSTAKLPKQGPVYPTFR